MDTLISGTRNFIDEIDGSIVTGIRIEWQDDDIGFGQLEIKQTTTDKDIRFYIDNEMMGREFIKKVLGNIVDKAVLASEVS